MLEYVGIIYIIYSQNWHVNSHVGVLPHPLATRISFADFHLKNPGPKNYGHRPLPREGSVSSQLFTTIICADGSKVVFAGNGRAPPSVGKTLKKGGIWTSTELGFHDHPRTLEIFPGVVGQLKYFWNFHPKTWGKTPPIWLAHIFQLFSGGSTTNHLPLRSKIDGVLLLR